MLRKLIATVSAVLIFHSLSLAINARTLQALEPSYLSQFPSVEQVKAAYKGTDPVDGEARQQWVFIILKGLVVRSAGGRNFKGFTADEQRLMKTYNDAWGEIYDRWSSPQTRARLEKLNKQYFDDPSLTFYAVLRRFFSPEFVSYYYRATGQQEPTAETLAGNPETYLAESDKYIDNKEYERAVEVLKKTIALKPSLAAAHLNLGISYYYLEQTAKALTSLQRAVQLNPNDYQNHYWLGMTYSKEADDALAKATDPTETVTATFDQRKKYLDFAIPSFEKAVKLKPDDIGSSVGLGMSYLTVGWNEPGLDILTTAVRLAPDDAEANFYLGQAYLSLGRRNQALQIHKKLQTLDKDAARKLYEIIMKSK